MRIFRKPAKPTPPPRGNDDIIRAYENNQELTREECRILYELVDDPWDLGSDLHYRSYQRLITVADKYVEWQDIDWIVDYGCGVGTFTKALKDMYPHIKSIGVDFDAARAASSKHFGTDLFDYFYEMNASVTEYDLLRYKLPDLGIGRLCICFINSTFYVFKEQRRRKRIEHLSRLIERFEQKASSGNTSYLLATANQTDRAAVDAIDQHNPELVHLSRELTLDSRIDQFNSQLHTRIWTH